MPIWLFDPFYGYYDWVNKLPIQSLIQFDGVFLINWFLSTLSCKCIEFCGPFYWIGVVSLLNCYRSRWFFDFPIHINNCLKLFLTQCFTSVFDSSVSRMFTIWYSFSFSWTNLIPIYGKNFLHIIFVLDHSLWVMVLSVLSCLRFLVR